jgi:hypothetical protein
MKKRKKKKRGLKMTLNVEGEPVIIGSQKKGFKEWLKIREAIAHDKIK